MRKSSVHSLTLRYVNPWIDILISYITLAVYWPSPFIGWVISLWAEKLFWVKRPNLQKWVSYLLHFYEVPKLNGTLTNSLFLFCKLDHFLVRKKYSETKQSSLHSWPRIFFTFTKQTLRNIIFTRSYIVKNYLVFSGK